MADPKSTTDPAEQQPTALGTIRAMFEDFNVPEVSDEICTRVLDVLYKYTCDVVQDAKAVAKHTSHQNVEESDMKWAIDASKKDLLFAPPHKEQLLAYTERNNSPLPPIRSPHGLQIPTEKHTLVAPNYKFAKPVSENESQSVLNGRQLSSGVITNTNAMPAVPIPASQSVYRLASVPTNAVGPGTSVRVIAPSGTGPSMIRIQSIQSLVPSQPATDAGFTSRGVTVPSVASIPAIQRRLDDGS